MTAAALVAAVTVVLGGCSTDSDEPSVASAVPEDATAVQTVPSTPDAVEEYLTGRTKFAECLRENGLPNVEDPDELGQVNVDFTKPATTKALKLCESVGPKAGSVPPEIVKRVAEQDADEMTDEEKQLERDLAECIQKNGVPDYPDPQPNGLPGTPAWAKPGTKVPRPGRLDRALEVCNTELGIGPSSP